MEEDVIVLEDDIDIAEDWLEDWKEEEEDCFIVEEDCMDDFCICLNPEDSVDSSWKVASCLDCCCIELL